MKKTLEKRNAQLAARERTRKAVVTRNLTKKIWPLKDGAHLEHVRTCACGKTIRGNAYFVHAAVCQPGKRDE